MSFLVRTSFFPGLCSLFAVTTCESHQSINVNGGCRSLNLYHDFSVRFYHHIYAPLFLCQLHAGYDANQLLWFIRTASCCIHTWTHLDICCTDVHCYQIYRNAPLVPTDHRSLAVSYPLTQNSKVRSWLCGDLCRERIISAAAPCLRVEAGWCTPLCRVCASTGYSTATTTSVSQRWVLCPDRLMLCLYVRVEFVLWVWAGMKV